MQGKIIRFERVCQKNFADFIAILTFLADAKIALAGAAILIGSADAAGRNLAIVFARADVKMTIMFQTFLIGLTGLADGSWRHDNLGVG